MSEPPEPHQRTVGRWLAAIIGLMFVAIAGYLALRPDNGTGAWIAAAILALLGIDALIAAVRARPSLIGRIGPLP